jgi:MFS family permease
MAGQTSSIEQRRGWQVERVSLWNGTFVVLCVAQLLCHANRTMLEPVLALYLVSVGQTPAFVGVTVAAFSLVSIVTRPFLGQGVDRWSVRGVYVLGALALAAGSFSYLVPLLAVLLVGRLVHGAGWAGINTAGNSLVSITTPAGRRAEAIGYFSMMPGLAVMLLPAAGLWLTGIWGFQNVFALSGVMGLLAALAARRIREVPRRAQPGRAAGFWESLLAREALLPSFLDLLISGTYPILTTFVALYAQARGIDNLAPFFLACGLTMILAYSQSGLSDRWGRAPLTAFSFASSVLGLGLMLWATDLWTLTAGGVLTSAGSALSWTTLLALAVDRSPADRRGATVATFSGAFQVGAGASGLLWGFLIDWYGFEAMFLAAIAFSLAGLLVLGVTWKAVSARAQG